MNDVYLDRLPKVEKTVMDLDFSLDWQMRYDDLEPLGTLLEFKEKVNAQI